MRVLHVIPSIAPRYGGPSRAVVEMAKTLQQQGVDVLIATTDADGPNRLPVDNSTTTEHDGIKVRFFPRRFSEAFKFAPGMKKWLKANVEQFEIIHIHAIFNHSSILAGKISRRCGIPYIVRPLGTLDPWSLKQRRFMKQALLMGGAKKLITGAAALHCTTQAEYDVAGRLPFTLPPPAIISLGVSRTLFQPENFVSPGPTVAANPFLLFLGRLDPKKRLDTLIEAFAKATSQQHLSHWTLVLAGRGTRQYEATLRSTAANLGIHERVCFPGWLAGVQKEDALREAAVLALISHQENFGLAVAEAMAVGTPVIVTEPVNLSPVVREQNAGWVVPSDSGGLAEELTTIFSDHGELAQRGHQGAAFANANFDWNTIGRALERAYQSILQRRISDAVN